MVVGAKGMMEIEADVALPQLVGDLDQVGERAPEAVDPGDGGPSSAITASTGPTTLAAQQNSVTVDQSTPLLPQQVIEPGVGARRRSAHALVTYRQLGDAGRRSSGLPKAHPRGESRCRWRLQCTATARWRPLALTLERPRQSATFAS